MAKGIVFKEDFPKPKLTQAGRKRLSEAASARNPRVFYGTLSEDPDAVKKPRWTAEQRKKMSEGGKRSRAASKIAKKVDFGVVHPGRAKK